MGSSIEKGPIWPSSDGRAGVKVFPTNRMNEWDEREGIVVNFPTVSWDLSECYSFEFGEGVPLSGSLSRSAGCMYLTARLGLDGY